MFMLLHLFLIWCLDSISVLGPLFYCPCNVPWVNIQSFTGNPQCLDQTRQGHFNNSLALQKLGSLTMCLSDNVPLLLYSDGANGDYSAVRPFAVVQVILYCASPSSRLPFSLLLIFLLSSIPIFFFFSLYTWFSFHSSVNAGLDSAHTTLFPLSSLKLIYFISSALTTWWPGRGQ